MAYNSARDLAFTIRFNEINPLYKDDKLDEVIDKAQELLEEDALPRYHRMRTLVLLGSSLGDWYEAHICCEEAEALWRIVRRWQPEGEDPEKEASLSELYEHIMELKEALRVEEPSTYDEDGSTDDDARSSTDGDAEASAESDANADVDARVVQHDTCVATERQTVGIERSDGADTTETDPKEVTTLNG